MMIITQATHFVGAQLIRTLNQHNFKYLIAVDDDLRSFPPALSSLNLQQRLLSDRLASWVAEHPVELEGMFHLDDGNPTQGDDICRMLWQAGVKHQIPFIFRATPSRSAWVKQQTQAPFFWAGLTWSHAFGPGDEGWVSLAYQSVAQGKDTPNRPSEARSLVYSRDIASVCYFLIRRRQSSQLHSLDSALPVSYEQIARWVRQAYENQNRSPDVREVPPTATLQAVGYPTPFFSTEAAVYDYAQNYLRG